MWQAGPLLIAVRGPLAIAASLVVEHRLQTRRLSNCGSWAQPLCGMWDLPRPGLEPVSPALAGRFSTTAPPGKPETFFLIFSTEIHLNGFTNSHCNQMKLVFCGFNSSSDLIVFESMMRQSHLSICFYGLKSQFCTVDIYSLCKTIRQ